MISPYPFFYGSGAFALQDVLVAVVGMMFWQRGPAAMAVALMRLRRNQRRVATTPPLTEAYPAALGGRSELFDPEDEPRWPGLPRSPGDSGSN